MPRDPSESRPCHRRPLARATTRTLHRLAALTFLALLSGCASQGHRGAATDEIPPDIARIPDAVPKVEPLAKSGNPDSYEVRGKRYIVRHNSQGYVERGVASWYGGSFHGRKTSSGEIYDMRSMSAAHKTLPLPTYARVTNMENGRSVVVRINDRGPFHGPRLIDLSYVAAAKLGVVKHGTAEVEIRAIDPRHSDSSPGAGPFLASESRRSNGFGDLGDDAPSAPPARSTPKARPTSTASQSPRPLLTSEAPRSSGFDDLDDGMPSAPPARSMPGARPTATAIRPASTSSQVETPVLASESRASSALDDLDDDLSSRPPARSTPKASPAIVASADSRPATAPRTSPAARAGLLEKIPSATPQRLATPAVAFVAPTAERTSVSPLYLQIGAFGDPRNAERLRARLTTQLLTEDIRVLAPEASGPSLYKVRIGPLSSERDAVRLTERLAALGMETPRVVRN